MILGGLACFLKPVDRVSGVPMTALLEQQANSQWLKNQSLNAKKLNANCHLRIAVLLCEH
jgi:hypothetical protein